MNNDTKIQIQTIGQVCNLLVGDEKTKLKSFNIQKEGGLVTTLVKHVYQDDRERIDLGDLYVSSFAVEFRYLDELDGLRDGSTVIVEVSESEAEKVRSEIPPVVTVSSCTIIRQ